MANQIEVKEDSGASEDPKLVEKVDEMMDPEIDESNPEDSPSPEETAKSDPVLDIFADVSSAPLLVKTKKEKTNIVLDDKDKKKTKKIVDIEPIEDQIKTTPETDLIKDPLPPVKDNEPDESIIEPLKRAEEFDDPSTARAINEIVAEESDEVLMIEDSKLAKEQFPLAKEKRFKHPFFWALVILVCLVGVAIAVFVIDPSIHDPLAKVKWHHLWLSLKKHL